MKKYIKTDILYLGISRIHRNRANLIQTLKTVSAIKNFGINITLLLPPKKKKLNLEKRLKEIGVSVDLDIRFTQFLHSRWKKLGYIPLFWFYKNLINKAKTIYVRSPRLSICLTRQNIPHCLEIHNTDRLQTENYLDHIIYYYNKQVIKHLFPISKAAAKFLIEAGAAPNRITVAPSGVDISFFKDIKPFNENNLSYPNIFYIGRISRDRGLDILLSIAKQGLGKVHLVGETEDPIKSIDNLIYYGYVPHSTVAKYYEQSDIILLPYQKDLNHVKSISPLKLFEAMASGRPIIASDIQPIREILVHKKNSLLCDPSDITAWISCIKELKSNHSLAKKIGLEAQQEVYKYTWGKRAFNILKSLKLL